MCLGSQLSPRELSRETKFLEKREWEKHILSTVVIMENFCSCPKSWDKWALWHVGGHASGTEEIPIDVIIWVLVTKKL